MQETGRRGAPSLFCPFATHRTVHRALFRTACQALLRTAWRPPAPAPPSSPHRRLRRSRVVRIIAAHRTPSAPTVHATVRIFVRCPSPACRIPDHAVPRACRCPAAFLRTSGVRFAHVTQQMYAHLFNTLKINILQSRQKKDNLLTESKLHFSGFPPSGTELPIRNLHDAFFCLYWRKIITNTLLT